MSPLPLVRAEGPPLERGRAIGSGLAAPIARSLEFYWRYLVRRGVGPGMLPDLLGPYLSAAERELPDLVELVSGMAEGAGVSFWELFFVNAFEELDPRLQGGAPGPVAEVGAERCSTVTVTGPGVTLLGHNEQWPAGDLGNAAVVVEVPDDGGPAVVSPTLACCLPAVGVNAHGAAQGIQSLAARDDRVGVPRVLVSRHALAAASPADALRRATLPGRAGGYGHSLAFAGGHALMVETTATRFAVAGSPGAHTNHYLDPELAGLAPPPSAGSAARLARLRELLAARAPATAADVGELLADHASHPQAICEHDRPRDGDPEGSGEPQRGSPVGREGSGESPGGVRGTPRGVPGGPGGAPVGWEDEADAVVFSMVCDLEAGRLWVAPGPPCRTAYEEVDLDGVV